MRKVFILASTLALLLGACENSGEVGRLTTSATSEVNLPPQLLGLGVKPEDITKTLEDVDNPYVDSFGLFSFREGEILRATLQVGTFSSSASHREPAFKARIVGLIGSADPKKVPVSKTDVYVSPGSDETRYMWFEGRGFFLLTVHKSYPFPRTLLRRLIGVENKLG